MSCAEHQAAGDCTMDCANCLHPNPTPEEEEDDDSDENLIASGSYTRCYDCGKVVPIQDCFVKTYEDPALEPDDFCNDCAVANGFVPAEPSPVVQRQYEADLVRGESGALSVENQRLREYLQDTDSGIFYRQGTPAEVIKAISSAYNKGFRVRISHGDLASGAESYMEIGYIGKTGGFVKAPILLANCRSTGGVEIVTEDVIRVEATGAFLGRRTRDGRNACWRHMMYIHPNYHVPPPPVFSDPQSRVQVFLENLQV